MRAARREAHVVVDLGFGDAGKGTLTDHLTRTRGAHTVVRFNGGAQAGHNVVTDDGRHHTFAQLGAGSFSPGVRTWLTRHVVVHPTALVVEARHLARNGVTDALSRVTVSTDAKVVTPFHQAATRLRELARGGARHGSCGVGVGEVMLDATTHGEVVRAGELSNTTSLKRALEAVRARKRDELAEVLRAVEGVAEARRDVEVFESSEVIDAWVDALGAWREGVRVVDDARFAEVLMTDGAVVFEGAQGVLLDEWRGTHPHTTWSTCTFDNADELLREHGYDGAVRRLGVLRAYATRHGAGPLPTEDAALTASLAEPHNPLGAWQGAFRAGWSDRVLARYALAACGRVDAIALTHLDRLAGRASWRVCDRYAVRDEDRDLFDDDGRTLRLGPWQDLAHQSRITAALNAAKPLYEEVSSDTEAYVSAMERALGVAVTITSWGPRAGDKCGR
jgi:adenylosuccinate synthase